MRFHASIIAFVLGAVAAGGGGCDGPSRPGEAPQTEDRPPTTAPAAGTTTTNDSSAPDRSTDTPQDDPGGGTAAVSGPGDDPTVARFHGLVAPKPATWIWHPPQNRMRTANWVIPGRDGSDMAELVVFAFPAGEGGTRDQNIERWATRFRSTDGEPVDPIIHEMQVDGMPLTVVEFAGEHMKMGAAWFTPDQMLIGGIVEQPQGLVFVRLTGPVATVEAHRAAFMRMLEGLRRDPGGP